MYIISGCYCNCLRGWNGKRAKPRNCLRLIDCHIKHRNLPSWTRNALLWLNKTAHAGFPKRSPRLSVAFNLAEANELSLIKDPIFSRVLAVLIPKASKAAMERNLYFVIMVVMTECNGVYVGFSMFVTQSTCAGLLSASRAVKSFSQWAFTAFIGKCNTFTDVNMHMWQQHMEQRYETRWRWRDAKLGKNRPRKNVVPARTALKV